MDAQRRDLRGDLMPAVVTAMVAGVCTAVSLLIVLDSGSGALGNREARMITAAAVARAGAIEIPSGPPAGQPGT